MSDDKTTASPVRRTALELAIGAVAGFAVSSFAAPTIISWKFTPLSKNALSCAEDVRAALSGFVMIQLVCAFLGGVGLTLALLLVRRALKKRADAKPAMPA